MAVTEEDLNKNVQKPPIKKDNVRSGSRTGIRNVVAVLTAGASSLPFPFVLRDVRRFEVGEAALVNVVMLFDRLQSAGKQLQHPLPTRFTDALQRAAKNMTVDAPSH